MLKDFSYILDRSSKKFICPQCGGKTFVRYIDRQTNKYLSKEFGRCDREEKCQYHNKPGKQEQPTPQPAPNLNNTTPKKINVPERILKSTLAGYSENIFIQNLLKTFDKTDIERVISLYYLGTIKHGKFRGSVTFPFINMFNEIRAIQTKLFDNSNHTKETSFIHAIYKHETWVNEYQKQDKKIDCLFAEHLLNTYPRNPIALVEAPKTAIISTLYYGFPDNPANFLWLAVYNLSSLNYEKLKRLQGRTIVLFPDLSTGGTTFKKWKSRGQEISKKLPGTKIYTDDTLERLATKEQREAGADLADFLINYEPEQFKDKPQKPAKPEKPKKQPEKQAKQLTKSELLKIAEQQIGHNNNVDPANIPYFEQMKSTGIIKRAEPTNKYYIINSNPF